VLGAGFPEVAAVAQSLKKYPEIVAVNSIATLVPGAPAQQAQAIANSPQARSFVARLISTDKTKTIVEGVTRHGPQADQVDVLIEQLRRDLRTLTPAAARSSSEASRASTPTS